MALNREQIPKNPVASFPRKWIKNQRARWIRRQMKNLDFVPLNKFKGWAD